MQLKFSKIKLKIFKKKGEKQCQDIKRKTNIKKTESKVKQSQNS